MNIISQLYYQLPLIEKFFKEDINNNEVISEYNFAEIDHSFLDVYLLQAYLTETNIANTRFIQIILNNCDSVVDLWNGGIYDLPHKELENRFHFKDEQSPILYSTSKAFRCVAINAEGFRLHKNDNAKKYFFKNFYYKSFIAEAIVVRCAFIRDVILEAYPDLRNPNSNKKKDLPRYCEVGSLFAQGFLKKDISKYYYKQKEFLNPTALDNYLKEDVLKDIKTSTIQYIRDTLNDVDTEDNKNIYKSRLKIENIINYCEQNNIDVEVEFSSMLKSSYFY